jgi:hypothetical protein
MAVTTEEKTPLYKHPKVESTVFWITAASALLALAVSLKQLKRL